MSRHWWPTSVQRAAHPLVRSLLLILLLTAPAVAQEPGSDTIHALDGTRYVGHILEVSDGGYWIELTDGRVVQVALADIERVERAEPVDAPPSPPSDESSARAWRAENAHGERTSRVTTTLYLGAFGVGVNVQFRNDRSMFESVGLQAGLAGGTFLTGVPPGSAWGTAHTVGPTASLRISGPLGVQLGLFGGFYFDGFDFGVTGGGSVRVSVDLSPRWVVRAGTGLGPIASTASPDVLLFAIPELAIGLRF